MNRRTLTAALVLFLLAYPISMLAMQNNISEDYHTYADDKLLFEKIISLVQNNTSPQLQRFLRRHDTQLFLTHIQKSGTFENEELEEIFEWATLFHHLKLIKFLLPLVTMQRISSQFFSDIIFNTLVDQDSYKKLTPQHTESKKLTLLKTLLSLAHSLQKLPIKYVASCIIWSAEAGYHSILPLFFRDREVIAEIPCNHLDLALKKALEKHHYRCAWFITRQLMQRCRLWCCHHSEESEPNASITPCDC